MDWRFLFPDPTLNRVGYVGNMETPLGFAISRFCKAVISVVPGRIEANPAPFEVLISDQAPLAALKEGTRNLIPGGLLYCELPTTAYLLSRPRYIRALKKFGYVEIEMLWARPDFERCLDLIPLQKKHALKYFFGRNPVGAKGLLMSLCGVALAKSGALNYLVSNVCVVARKSMADPL